MSGCSSKAVPLDLLPDVRESNSGNITLVRSDSFNASGLTVYVTVDGKNLIYLSTNEYTKIKLPTGKHTVLLTVPIVGFFSPDHSKTYPLDFTLKNNEDLYFYIDVNRMFSSTPFSIKLISETQAKARIAQSSPEYVNP